MSSSPPELKKSFAHKVNILTNRIFKGEKREVTVAQVQPFDLILFRGDDAVGKMISKIEGKHVAKTERKRFGILWTHAGVIVDKTVLPLDCLEEGKLYVYESILTGTVLGVYPYSLVNSQDHPVENIKTQSYAGPQLREFVAVVTESAGDVGIARLADGYRTAVYAEGLQKVQKTMLELHAKYFDYGYPFGIFQQVGAASDKVYRFNQTMKKFGKDTAKFTKLAAEVTVEFSRKVVGVLKQTETDSIVVTEKVTVTEQTGDDDEFIIGQDQPDGSSPVVYEKKTTKAVFCSQFAAIIFAAIGLPGFEHSQAGKFTPLELDAMDCFEQENYFVRYNGQLLLGSDGKTVTTLL
ncbi:hypothetical protein HDV03_001747 [Kappamyces sp. JEL0829]|nr:hypothetical protein HDV03_001747 [Kappamyces sp. JEL0829]